VHLYCSFSMRRQMAPQQSAKFRTTIFGEFCTSLGKGEREGKERVRKRKEEGGEKGIEGESVPLALILQFDHCLPIYRER